MIKLEPIEFNKNCTVTNTSDISTSMSHSNPMKRWRNRFNSSNTNNTLTQSSLTNQLISTANLENEEHGNLMIISDDDELSNSQQSDHMDEEIPIIDHHISSKRPRLSYNKRLVANARERERVHNLTAAFEALRRVLPIYGDQSKLSRLSILRIACSYVYVLGVLNEIDFSEGENAYTLHESFHMLSSTIAHELKRKKFTK